MARHRRIFVFWLLLIVGTEALKIPDYIKPCSRNDPKFNDCALKNGREAMPIIIRGDRKLGVPVLDPLFVEKASISQAGIHATSINLTIVGAKEAELEAFIADFDRHVITICMKAPRVTLSGSYDVKGRVMGLPLYGQGDYRVVFEKPHGNYSTNYTLTQLADGEKYLVPVAYDIEYDMEGMTVNFENLFNGNKMLGDTMNNLINENWRILVEDLGKPAIYAFGGIINQIFMNVSQKLPYDELFPK